MIITIPRFVKASALITGIPITALALREHRKAHRRIDPTLSVESVLSTPLHSGLTRWYRLFRPVMFALTPDAETAHGGALFVGEFMGWIYCVKDTIKRGVWCNTVRFSNFFFGKSSTQIFIVSKEGDHFPNSATERHSAKYKEPSFE